MARTEYVNGECAAEGKNETNKERRGTEDKTDKPVQAAKERRVYHYGSRRTHHSSSPSKEK